MNSCPVCGLPGPAPVAGEANGYVLRLCPQCDVTYADPMRGPGAKWYEEHSDYLKFLLLDLDVLNWNHRQFLRDLPRRGGQLGRGTACPTCTMRAWRSSASGSPSAGSTW